MQQIDKICRITMDVSRTVNNISDFKKTWFDFEIDCLLRSGVKKSDIASILKTNQSVLSVALRKGPSDNFLDKFMKAYGMSITMNRAYEGYGIFYIERKNILSWLNYPIDCRPMTEDTKFYSFSDFKKAWLKLELDGLKDLHIHKKDIAKKLNFSQVYLSIYTSKTPSDNFIDRLCDVYDIQFVINNYSNDESMSINGKFTIKPQKKEETSTFSKMYLKIAEEKYKLEQELMKKNEEISELKQQITLLKSEKNLQ